MTTSEPTTNGEFYNYELRQWFVMCGPDNVPFRKQDASGKPIVPEPADKQDENDEHIHPI